MHSRSENLRREQAEFAETLAHALARSTVALVPRVMSPNPDCCHRQTLKFSENGFLSVLSHVHKGGSCGNYRDSQLGDF